MDYQLKIRDIGALTTPCQPFEFKNPPLDPIQLAKDMVKLLYQYNGIGLAANQIGVPYRVFALRASPENFCCFNPKIVGYSREKITLEEGCLSFPDVLVPIERSQHIRVRFSNPNGEVVTKQFTGLSARVFQHEMDHLEGKLFYTRAPRLVREKAFRKAQANGNKTYIAQIPGEFDNVIASVSSVLDGELLAKKIGAR